MIKHPLFISTLSVKYVHPSQRGQQAVKHIMWTLGPGQLPAGIMWPLCKVCSIENTFMYRITGAMQCSGWQAPAQARFGNEVMLFQCTCFIFTGAFYFLFFLGETQFCWKESSLNPIKRFGQITFYWRILEIHDLYVVSKTLSPDRKST